MSRKAIDPVERAFQYWRALTAEQQRRVADMQTGYCAAHGLTPPNGGQPTPRKRKAAAPPATEGK